MSPEKSWLTTQLIGDYLAKITTLDLPDISGLLGDANAVLKKTRLAGEI